MKNANIDIEKINNIFLSKLEEMRKVNSYIPYVSIGYSHFDPEYENISDVLETADKNLYFWKNKLKNDRENLKK